MKELDIESKSPDNISFEDVMKEVRGMYEQARKIYRAQEEETWNSLSYDQQLDVFCAVVRRIVLAELIDDGSYRHALYTVFKFDMDAYGRAMDAGYMELHNSIGRINETK